MIRSRLFQPGCGCGGSGNKASIRRQTPAPREARPASPAAPAAPGGAPASKGFKWNGPTRRLPPAAGS